VAFSTVPSPLYGLYRARDQFSVFMVTVIYAVYAVGVIGALHLSDWYGRRRLLLPALGIAIVSAIVFLVSKSLTGLLAARLINGISIGIVPSTATAFLVELHARGRPAATARKAQLTAAAVNVGGLGVGALAAGCSRSGWRTSSQSPISSSWRRFCSPRSASRSLRRPASARHHAHYRAQRLSVPQERSRFFSAALSAFLAFAAIGLFTAAPDCSSP
jgi:MFS family permease